MNNKGKDQQKKDQVFKIIQNFLKNPPVIIWGSGATIPYGLPSMDNLKQALQKQNIVSLNSNENLEVELGKISDQKQIDKIKKCIRYEVLKKDIECLKNAIEKTNYFDVINKMIKKIYEPHPQKIDIVTTNYDRVLEYAISKLSLPYTDGFTGRQLSQFNEDAFQNENQINLMKVHGSLNWFQFENYDPFFLSDAQEIDQLQPLMVLPRIQKYKEAFEEPYRTIIAKTDEVIKKAKSFLVIGFGFNDNHITPKLENKIRNGTPIVIITKRATDSCKNKLKKTIDYCLFEKGDENETTKITSSKQQKQNKLKGNYWKLNTFMEVL